MGQNSQIVEATERGDTAAHNEVKYTSLLATIKEEISRKPLPKSYIYKVPINFRTNSDKDTYEPRIISIGPYHHCKDTFRTTEEHKKWYLHDLIHRSTTPNSKLEDFVQAIGKMEKDARDCYAEPISLSSQDFIKMMVFDGCFILELLYKYSEKRAENKKENDLEDSNDNNDDPILGTSWMIYSLRKDLVLLENQIPFIVLEKLFELSRFPNRRELSLSALVTMFFNPILPTVRIVQTNSQVKSEHILDLLRNLLLPASHLMEVGNYPFWEYTQCATDLSETGVKFKKKINADCLLDITFTDGVLEIPAFVFGESWTILLPNLIALEQCRRDYTDQVTSYVILMDSLINNEKDVKELRKKGIIDGLFHEDEKVASEINNLCKGAFVDKFYYDGLCNRVNAYCRTRWHRWRATLVHDYFNTPWAYISFFAALILLLLTATQTVSSIIK